MRRAILALVVAAVAFAACDGTTSSETSELDGGPEVDAGESNFDCPKEAPAAGESCSLPPGTTCAFEACGTFATCKGGAWAFAGNPARDVPCPEGPTPPLPDTPCPDCWPGGKTCTYFSDACFKGDAGDQQIAVGECNRSKRWFYTYHPCPSDAGEDGAADAGADVQGDAESDAD